MNEPEQTFPAAAIPPLAAPVGPRAGASEAPRSETESLFERFGWLYAFFRERLFRDDTAGIAAALWPQGEPPAGSQLLELACGPGFYCCQFAERFPQLEVLGIDRSRQQLRRARWVAGARGLANARFEQGDALRLASPDESVDSLLAARLFTILPEREEALAEMHRVLKTGGRCFIAEPCSRLRALAPLRIMWVVANIMAFCGNDRTRAYREPPDAIVLPPDVFGALVQSRPWRSVWRWQDGHYQYAICEKGESAAAAPSAPVRRSKPAVEDYSI